LEGRQRGRESKMKSQKSDTLQNKRLGAPDSLISIHTGGGLRSEMKKRGDIP